MGNVADLARAEAERAEAEQPDDADAEAEADEQPAEHVDQPAEGEQPPEQTPEQAQAMSERAMAAMMDKLEKEAARHSKRIAEIMGDDFALLLPCPLDFTPGFIWSPEVAPVPDEVKEAVRLVIGEQPRPDLRQAPDKTTCDECDGAGRTLTGALPSAQYELPCRKCNGQGWMANVSAAPLSLSPTPLVPAANVNGPAATPERGPDAWGRPGSHPHWGINPADVGTY